LIKQLHALLRESPIQIKSFISGNTAHRKKETETDKHKNTLRITSRQKDRQTKLSELHLQTTS